MERLTRRDYGEEQLLYGCDNCIRGLGVDNPPCGTCDYELEALERLAAYEDTDLTPEEVKELAEAKAEGRLVVLPCRVGDTVFVLCRVQLSIKFGDLWNGRIVENNCQRCAWSGCECCGEITNTTNEAYRANAITIINNVGEKFIFNKRHLFGKTIFLSREEAEAALLKEKEDTK